MACENCDWGKVNAQFNLAFNCDECDSGRFSSVENTICTDCPQGKFHPSSGKACKSCAAGSIAAIDKQTSCDHCPSGRFQGVDGYYLCNACVAGKWTEGEAGATVCLAKPREALAKAEHKAEDALAEYTAKQATITPAQRANLKADAKAHGSASPERKQGKESRVFANDGSVDDDDSIL
jgi:hypothetical protein